MLLDEKPSLKAFDICCFIVCFNSKKRKRNESVTTFLDVKLEQCDEIFFGDNKNDGIYKFLLAIPAISQNGPFMLSDEDSMFF